MARSLTEQAYRLGAFDALWLACEGTPPPSAIRDRLFPVVTWWLPFCPRLGEWYVAGRQGVTG